MTKIRKKINCAKCGKVLDLSRIFKYAYCKACHAEHARRTRPAMNELSPLAQMKAVARTAARQHVKREKIPKKPCFGCGNPKTEMHHEDYSKPLDIIWMCRECHLDYHQWKKGAVA